MLARILAAAIAVVVSMPSAAAQKRVALLIGQNAYPGSASATVGLKKLLNSGNDVARVAALLGKHGFEVVSCDKKRAGCFDLDRAGLLAALDAFRAKADGAQTALVYFAGHGMATQEGNILAPVDAKVSCATGAVTQGIAVEHFMDATGTAPNKLVVLDACRDNPIGDVCPALKGKKLSFTRIEAGARPGLLLVTSTHFGQQALDGPPGANSPFAAALVAALEEHPAVYFEQVINEAGRATHAAAQQDNGFQQIPGKIVGTPAPADCLAGRGCIGDSRMAAVAQENERLTAALAREAELAQTAKGYLNSLRRQRGRALSDEEQRRELATLKAATTELAARHDTRGEEAIKRLGQGDATAAKTLFAEAAAARKTAAAAAAERARAENREAARSIRHLAALARPSNIAEALGHYLEATELDPADAEAWINYGEVAVEAGRLDVAMSAFQQAALKARDVKQPLLQSKGNYRIGDVLREQGNLPSARRSYETAFAIIEPLAKSDPGNASWQRDLSVSQEKIGDVLVAQGNLPEAMKAFNASLAIRDRLAKSDPENAGWQRDVYLGLFRLATVMIDQGHMPSALAELRRRHEIIDRLAKSDPGNAGWQRDLSVSHIKIGDVLLEQGNLAEALKAFNAALSISDRLAKFDPGNAGWQRDLSASQQRIGNILGEQGNLPEALKAFIGSLAISDRLAKSDPGNAGWQRNLALIHGLVARVLAQQGERGQALAGFRESRAIIARLQAASPTNATLPKDLAWFDAQIAALEKDQR